jgi:hypothetical protein
MYPYQAGAGYISASDAWTIDPESNRLTYLGPEGGISEKVPGTTNKVDAWVEFWVDFGKGINQIGITAAEPNTNWRFTV